MIRIRTLEEEKKIRTAAVCIIAATSAAYEIMQRKKRTVWSRKCLLQRQQLGCYENLMRELRFEDTEYYRRWIRMDCASFDYILEKVTPRIARTNTCMRESIPPEERLALTLRYLATGESQSSLAFQFQIAQSTISGIITEVCQALYDVLKEELLNSSKTEEEWRDIAQEFYDQWNFPMCIGAIDGKHVKITPARGYKGDSSIVLLALVDANLKFIYVDVGINDRVSYAGMWVKSQLKKLIDEHALGIPEADFLPGSRIKVPYVMVADDAFPLSIHLMKPYSGKNLEEKKIIFNYRLSRARRVSENAFGILAARFQIYKSRIMTTPLNCQRIVLATTALHNFLLKKNPSLYTPEGSLDVEDVANKNISEGDWRRSSSSALASIATFNECRSAEPQKVLQNIFSDFFSGSGAVSWQREICNLH